MEATQALLMLLNVDMSWIYSRPRKKAASFLEWWQKNWRTCVPFRFHMGKIWFLEKILSHANWPQQTWNSKTSSAFILQRTLDPSLTTCYCSTCNAPPLLVSCPSNQDVFSDCLHLHHYFWIGSIPFLLPKACFRIYLRIYVWPPYISNHLMTLTTLEHTQQHTAHHTVSESSSAAWYEAWATNRWSSKRSEYRENGVPRAQKISICLDHTRWHDVPCLSLSLPPSAEGQPVSATQKRTTHHKVRLPIYSIQVHIYQHPITLDSRL